MIDQSTYLAILQQTEYDVSRLKQWVKDHPHSPHVEPEKWTAKLRLLKSIGSLFFFLSPLQQITIGVGIIHPFEQLVRQYYYAKAKRKLNELKKKGLIVVALAGSYGKTSTKNILAHSFATTHKVLITPKSINTLLGIAQVILQDLRPTHTLFIVEFGEYHPQDIPQLTQFVQPQYGVLTPIGRQHLEIIGGMEALVKTFHSFVNFFHDKKDLLIAEQNQQYFGEKLQYYGGNSSFLKLENITVSRSGTEGKIHTNKGASMKFFTPLFGAHQAENFLPSVWLAEKVSVSAESVIKQFASQPYITRRHEPTFAEHDVLILDNSYNSNPDSVQASFTLLNQLKKSTTIMVTLGFVEQDENGAEIHTEFGKQLAKHVDFVGLISSPWTNIIKKGFLAAGGKETHLVVAGNQEEAIQKLSDRIIPHTVIVLEGGYQDLHR